MDQTLSALGDILLKALPTFFLVVFLYVYLRKVFFHPLGTVLEARREATEGARQRAEEAFQKAEQKAAEYEAALQAARAELYREQEAEWRKALDSRAARVQQARVQAGEQLRQAREAIAADVDAAKKSLASQSDALADQIIHIVLEKGASA
ncbi:MAG: ATP synthase F0 subunit B [Acidobacteria bacterium]|nr:ATP synthase F0 subunit B [Acidobacteriota bacterium]